MLNQIKQAEFIVERILREYPLTRNDDRELTLKVWEQMGLSLILSQKEIFKKCLASESITRARRRLQESGRYLAEDEIKMARMKQEVKIREYIITDPITKRQI